MDLDKPSSQLAAARGREEEQEEGGAGASSKLAGGGGGGRCASGRGGRGASGRGGRGASGGGGRGASGGGSRGASGGGGGGTSSSGGQSAASAGDGGAASVLVELDSKRTLTVPLLADDTPAALAERIRLAEGLENEPGTCYVLRNRAGNDAQAIRPGMPYVLAVALLPAVSLEPAPLQPLAPPTPPGPLVLTAAPFGSEAAQQEAATPVEGWWVSLAGIAKCVAIAEEASGEALGDMTTEQFKQAFFLQGAPHRLAFQHRALACSVPGMAEHYRPSSKEGGDFVFVSHVYSNRLLDVLETLRAFEAAECRSGLTHYYYFDILVNDQEQEGAGKIPFNKLASTFDGHIQHSSTTLIVLDWGERDPFVVQSGWCGFELCAYIKNGSRVFYRVPPRSQPRFAERLTKDPASASEVLCSFDWAKCRTREPEDGEAIRAYMESHIATDIFSSSRVGGAEALNAIVNLQLRGFMFTEAQRHYEQLHAQAAHSDSARLEYHAFARAYLFFLSEHIDYQSHKAEQYRDLVAADLYESVASAHDWGEEASLCVLCARQLQASQRSSANVRALSIVRGLFERGGHADLPEALSAHCEFLGRVVEDQPEFVQAEIERLLGALPQENRRGRLTLTLVLVRALLEQHAPLDPAPNELTHPCTSGYECDGSRAPFMCAPKVRPSVLAAAERCAAAAAPASSATPAALPEPLAPLWAAVQGRDANRSNPAALAGLQRADALLSPFVVEQHAPARSRLDVNTSLRLRALSSLARVRYALAEDAADHEAVTALHAQQRQLADRMFPFAAMTHWASEGARSEEAAGLILRAVQEQAAGGAGAAGELYVRARDLLHPVARRLWIKSSFDLHDEPSEDEGLNEVQRSRRRPYQAFRALRAYGYALLGCAGEDVAAQRKGQRWLVRAEKLRQACLKHFYHGFERQAKEPEPRKSARGWVALRHDTDVPGTKAGAASASKVPVYKTPQRVREASSGGSSSGGGGASPTAMAFYSGGELDGGEGQLEDSALSNLPAAWRGRGSH